MASYTDKQCMRYPIDEPQENRFLQLLNALPKVAVQGYDQQRRVIYWNQSSVELYGYQAAEAQGEKLEDLIIPDEMRLAVITAHSNWIDHGVPIPPSELILKHKNGNAVPVFSTHVMLRSDSDSPEMFCIDVDLSEQFAARAELERIASHDLLTQLPNRLQLQAELEARLCDAERSGGHLALLLIDLDMFKEVNDTQGHSYGDELLKVVAERLGAVARWDDMLFRFGGDEFVLLVPAVSEQQQVEAIAEQLLAEFEQTFTVENDSLYITASIGISQFPDDGRDSGTLIRHADSAMYQAKGEGRNCYRFFNRQLNETLRYEREIALNLHHSLAAQEFELMYQPLYDMVSGRVVACEALLRWTPQDSSIAEPPGVFIPIAERSDLIIRLGQWVVENAFLQLSKWHALGYTDLRMGVNVSGKQLEQPSFFVLLDDVRQRNGLAYQDMGLELTEHSLIKANKDMLSQLRALKSAGVEIAIDDFGTGYASINYVKLFPISHLKIDRAFVDNAHANPQEGALLEAIVTVGHLFNLKVVVEGVETREQYDYCRSIGSDLAQGYWLSRPLTVDDFTRLLQRSNG